MRRLGITPSTVVAVAALVVACSGAAFAAGSSGSPVIAACVHRHGGGLYLAGRCARHDRRVRWSVTGPQGAVGLQGPAGSAGAAGSPGTPGTPGTPGAPATTLFAQIKADGTVNASSIPITVDHVGTGLYYVNFGRDITHCVPLANQGGVPFFNIPTGNTPAYDGYGVRVGLTGAGDALAPGFPSGDSVSLETWHGSAAGDTSFFVAVLC